MLRTFVLSMAVPLSLMSLACGDAQELPDVAAQGESGPMLEFKNGQLKIRAPGVNIDFDSHSGDAKVDIDTNGVRVYADETGRVEIDAPGVLVENEGEGSGEGERNKAKRSGQ